MSDIDFHILRSGQFGAGLLNIDAHILCNGQLGEMGAETCASISAEAPIS